MHVKPAPLLQAGPGPTEAPPPAAVPPTSTSNRRARPAPKAGARLRGPVPRPAEEAPTPSGEPAGSPTRRIAEAITTAIVERRLMPGTHLAEQAIADLFQVSRTLVRQALIQLARDHLVTLSPARGARVAQPSVEEARQVFEVRRMVEGALVQSLCEQITPAQITRLRAHLAEERRAVARTDVPGRTRLLADFHVLLAQLQGNQVLAGLLADLLSRCSLIALMYQSAHSAEQSQAEHAAIVAALARRDAAAAQALMAAHLDDVERNLQLHPRTADLAAALRPGLALP